MTMNVLHAARDKQLGNVIRMVRNLRLAHLLAEFRHECFVELTIEFGVLPLFVMFFPLILVL